MKTTRERWVMRTSFKISESDCSQAAGGRDLFSLQGNPEKEAGKVRSKLQGRPQDTEKPEW